MAVKPKLNPKGVNANDTMQDSVITHAINLERLKAGEVASVKSLLDNLEIDIQKRLEKIDPTGVGTTYRARRLAVLLKQVQATITKNFSKISESNANALKEVSKASAKATVNSINKALRVNLGATLPSASVLNKLNQTVLLQGDVVKSYWKQQSTFLKSNFSKQMRMGIASGDSVQTLIQRVRGTRDANFTNGIMNVSRRNAEALVRSSVSAVNNASAVETIGANQDIMNGYQWLATLDSRTSDVCKARSGLVWDLDFQPVGHSIAWSAPPAHFNCRSTVIGLLKPWNEISNKPLPEVDKDTYKEQLKKAYKAKGLSNVATLSALRRTQSSMDGYVAGDINFEDWLRKKPVKFQKDILGDDKWELWNNKKIGFVDLVNQNSQPRSLAELKALVEKGRTSVLKKNKKAKQKAKQDAEADVLKAKLAQKAEDEAQAFVDDLIAGIGGANQLKVFKQLVNEKAVVVNDIPVFTNISAVEVKALVQAGIDKINTAVLVSQAKNKIKAGKPLNAKEQTAWDGVDPDIKTAFVDGLENTKKLAKELAEAEETLSLMKAGGQGYSVHKKAYNSLKGKGQLTGNAVDDVKAIAILKDEIQTQATIASVKTGIKKKFASGKTLSASQQKVFDDLDISEQETLKQASKGVQTAVQEAKEQVVKAQERSKGVLWDDLEQTGGQAGSNLGGKFKSKVDGQEYYIKSPRTDDHVLNEQVANNLYKLLGVKVPDVQTIKLPKGASFRDGTAKTTLAVVSRWTDDLVQTNPSELAKASGTFENFGADAWLANWDVVGTGYDNLKLLNGTAFRVDAGGALKYRAMGGDKGAGWTKEVSDIETLRQVENKYNHAVFKNISEEQIVDSIRKVVALPDSAIRKAVLDGYGGFDDDRAKELMETLVARKYFLKNKYKKQLEAEKPAPVPASKEIYDDEYQNIVDSRVNGYSIATDKDQIEDQQVLFQHFKDENGKSKTKVFFKVMGKTQDKLDNATALSSTAINFEELDSKIKEAIIGIRHQIKIGEPLRRKDYDRLSAIKIKFKNRADVRVDDAVDQGIMTVDQRIEFEEYYEPFLKELDQNYRIFMDGNINNPSSIMPVWNLSDDILFSGKSFSLKASGKTNWKDSDGQWTLNELNRSNAFATTKKVKVIEYGEENLWKFDGGKTLTGSDWNIRYWNSNLTGENGTALKGRVEIEVDGNSIESARKAIALARKELGVDMDRASLIDREQLYLTRYLYLLDYEKFTDDILVKIKTMNQADKVNVLRQELDKALGKKVTGSPMYLAQLEGTHQAFGHGRKHQYRLDLSGKKWEDFTDGHRIIHDNQSDDAVETFKKIIDGGAQMSPTADKIRRGIHVGGMSPRPDMRSGGASYFFTRLRTVDNVNQTGGIRYVWKANVMKRIDSATFTQDVYGKMSRYNLTNTRRNDVSGYKAIAEQDNGKSSNETNFKDGLSLFDELETIIVSSSHKKEEMIEFMKSRGYKTWGDGRPLDDVIKTSDELDGGIYG